VNLGNHRRSSYCLRSTWRGGLQRRWLHKGHSLRGNLRLLNSFVQSRLCLQKCSNACAL